MHLFFSTRVCIASSERLWNKVLYKVNPHSFVSRVRAKALSRGEKNACQINWMGLVCLHKFIPLIYFNFSALCAHMQKSTQECMCAVLVKKIHLHQVLCALECWCAAVSELHHRAAHYTDADTFDVLLITPVPII
jgi:hypothetical protein